MEHLLRGTCMQKPQPHFTTKQWQTANWNMEKISQRRQLVSNNVRQHSDQYRNSIDNTIKWKSRESNNRLEDRISEVDQWYKNLERILVDLKDHIQSLSEAKMAAEEALRENLPLQEAAKEVINYRDRRREIDLVEDEPYVQTKKELELLETGCQTMRNLCHDAWIHLLSMKEQRDKLSIDLKNKETSLRIDNFQLSLTPKSTESISLKPHPLNTESTSVHPSVWLRNCIERNNEADARIVRAIQKTNDIWGALRTWLDDVTKQRETTQRALRKRIHETSQIRDKLGIQRSDLKCEIDELKKEMTVMESNINEKMPSIKLALTRLENRKFRPGMELCSDIPEQNIREELQHIRNSQSILEQHLRDMKNQLNGLQNQLHHVEDDLECKERSLAIDKNCLEAHLRPPKEPYKTSIAWRAPATSLDYSLQVARENNLENVEEILKEKPTPCDRVIDKETMTSPCEADEYLLID